MALMRHWALAPLLALPAPGLQGAPVLDDLKIRAAILPEAPEVGPARAVALPDPMLSERGLATVLQFAAPCNGCKTPAAVLTLSEILNSHWNTSSGFGSGGERVHLSAHFDKNGEMHLAVMGDDWRAPVFFLVQRGMSGRWTYRGVGYGVSLSVNIFRARLNNVIEIRRDGQQSPVYKARVRDLLLATYYAGRRVQAGGAIYRVFYYNEIDLDGAKPYRVSWDKFGISFVYDEAQDDGVPGSPTGLDHNYHIFKLSRQDVVGASPVRFAFFGGRRLGLRIGPDLQALEVYEAD